MRDTLIVVGYWFGIWLVTALSSFFTTYLCKSRRAGVTAGLTSTCILISVSTYFITTDPTPGGYRESVITIVILVIVLLLSLCTAVFLPRFVAAQRAPHEGETEKKGDE